MVDSFAAGAAEGWDQKLGGLTTFTSTAAPVSNSYNISEFSSAN